jgi:electron-transferring-flavoprotein dehydrogenase
MVSVSKKFGASIHRNTGLVRSYTRLVGLWTIRRKFLLSLFRYPTSLTPLVYLSYGGGWVYHMDGGLVSLGLVIGLDYANPYLSPYRELQRMKHHPYFRKLLSGSSERLAYGARTLNEGGLQAVPQLHFPGGALLGCSAGMVNIAKIKGTHNAMRSGMLAAEAAYDAVQTAANENDSEAAAADMSAYTTAFQTSSIHRDLHEVRNLRASFHTPLGLYGGILYSGIDTLFLKGRTPWTLRSSQITDAAHTKPASEFKPIDYPPFEAGLSSDLMTSVALTGTNHAEDQLVHLRVMKKVVGLSEARGVEGGPEAAVEGAVEESDEVRREHVKVNVGTYTGLLGRACPAGVYEYVDAEGGESVEERGAADGKKLVINSQVGARILGLILSSDCVGAFVRTAFIASSAISRCLLKTSHGPCQKAEEGPSTVSIIFNYHLRR